MFFLLAVIYIVFISLGLPDSVFGVVWPVIHPEFGIVESFASVYSIVIGICTGSVSFFSGKLIRRFGTGKVTAVSIFLTVIGMLGISISPNIVVMMLFSVVLGYGAGVIDSGLNNFVSLHYKSRHMNWLHCFWGIGVTLSPLIMSLFLKGDRGSWRNGYRVIALIQFVIFVIALFSLKKWNEVEKNDKIDSVSDSDENGVKFTDILKIPGVKQGILSLGFYCGMEFLIGTWGASYLVNVYSYPPDTAAKWISLYYGGIMFGRFISGIVSEKLNDRIMIKSGIFIALTGMIILLLPLGKFSNTGLLVIGIGFGPVFPGILHIIPERFGRTFSADITGFHMGGAYTVGFVTQLLFGYIATATTFKIMPFVLLAYCALLYLMNSLAGHKARKV